MGLLVLVVSYELKYEFGLMSGFESGGYWSSEWKMWSVGLVLTSLVSARVGCDTQVY